MAEGCFAPELTCQNLIARSNFIIQMTVWWDWTILKYPSSHDLLFGKFYHCVVLCVPGKIHWNEHASELRGSPPPAY